MPAHFVAHEFASDPNVCETASVKFGLRLQILVLLGGLMALAFLPLYFAISTYTTVALGRAHQDNSRALGRTLAAYVAEAQGFRDPARLNDLLEAQVGERIAAVGVYDAQGQLRAKAGSKAGSLTSSIVPGREAIDQLNLPEPLLAVTVPGPEAAVTVLVKVREHDADALNRLLALYMSLIALALLVAAYFTLTYWIVRPLDQISGAAKRIASPTRHLEMPRSRSLEVPMAKSRELQALADSLNRMTATLLEEEQALRHKVKEVEEATAQLTQAQAQLVRSERLASVGQLAAGLAHEVGNPIAAMQGMQDLLLEGDLEPELQQDFIRRMRKETERISRILQDLLQFARPTKSEHERQPGVVEAAINETVTLVSPQPALRDVDLQLDVYPDLPLVTLPHEQLIQVLLNLILNAAAARSDGNILVRARELETAGQKLVELTVEDNGPGVDPKLVDTLFEPFVSTKDVGEGTGLGLSVCKGLIEASGGSIQLDLSHQPGARFVVTLIPLEP